MTVRLEDKVSWTELASSVQNDFKKINKDILDAGGSTSAAISSLLGKINQEKTNMENNFTNVKNYITSNYSSSSSSSSTNDPLITKFINDNQYSKSLEPNKDEFIKINKEKNDLYIDDNFRSLNVVSSDAELAAVQADSSSIVSLENIFNTWYRFAHYSRDALSKMIQYQPEIDGFLYPYGSSTRVEYWQNDGYDGQYTTKWTFNASTQTIENPIDFSPYMGFISPSDTYTNYYLKLKYTSTDDDFVTIICGYLKDSAGIEHTLQVVRSSGGNSGSGSLFWWALVYDFDYVTQHVIVDKSSQIPKVFGGAFYFSLKRKDSTIEARTGDINNSTDNPAYDIKWTLPTSKPSDWSQAMYDNIKKMLSGPNRIGVGAVNMPVKFTIVEQAQVLDNGYIYSIHNNSVYDYDVSSASWKKIGSCTNMLPNRIFLYNPDSCKFYFYYDSTRFVQISGHDI